MFASQTIFNARTWPDGPAVSGGRCGMSAGGSGMSWDRASVPMRRTGASLDDSIMSVGRASLSWRRSWASLRDVRMSLGHSSLSWSCSGARIIWVKGEFDGVEIWVDRGNGVWVKLAVDMTPDYFDTEPLPATAQTWKYKARYLLDDAPVGQFSQVVEFLAKA